MTPYELNILLHYYCRTNDHPDFERQPMIWEETMSMFMAEGLLKVNVGRRGCDPNWSIADRGRVFCNALQRVPLPTAAWVIDWPPTDAT